MVDCALTGVAADVYALDMLVTQIEAAKQRTKRIGFEVLIETALGLANVEAIAQSSRRLEAMSFGAGDLAAGLAGGYLSGGDRAAVGRAGAVPVATQCLRDR